MKLEQSGEGVMDIRTSNGASGRLRRIFSASVVALAVACSVAPEPALAQFDLGSFAGGMIGGMLAGRGGGRTYGYSSRYRGRHSYVGRREEPRHVYAGRYHEPRVAQTRSAPGSSGPPAVASSPPASAPPVVHQNASGPGAGSLH